MKLNKNEGYQLLLKLLNFWSIRENALENAEEWIDDYLMGTAGPIYELALKWEGGYSREEKEKFRKSKGVDRLESEFLREHDRDDEFYDIDIATDLILEITHSIIKPHLDVEFKNPVAKIFLKTISSEEPYFNCPNCEKENKQTTRRSCRYCHVPLDFKEN